MKGIYKVKSVEETWELARDFAKDLRPGDVICLEGDLGAGKTTFTQALAAGLQAKGRVASPTFCIVREHHCAPGATAPMLVHMDLYRLSSPEDVIAIGWDDYLAKGAIIAVEWPERAGYLIPKGAHHVRFLHSGEEGEESRIIAIDIETQNMVK